RGLPKLALSLGASLRGSNAPCRGVVQRDVGTASLRRATGLMADGNARNNRSDRQTRFAPEGRRGHRRMVVSGGLVFLSVVAALRPGGDDAPTIRGLWDQRDGRRVDSGFVLLRLFAVQFGCRGCDGSAGTPAAVAACCRGCWHRRAAVRHGP